MAQKNASICKSYSKLICNLKSINTLQTCMFHSVQNVLLLHYQKVYQNTITIKVFFKNFDFENKYAKCWNNLM